jgi:transposase
MGAPRKYPDEVRDRAVRLVRDLVEGQDASDTVTGACRRIGEQLGINTDTLRNWVKQGQVDDGARPGVSSEEKTRIRQLERENAELRRANAILKTASAFFAAELDRPQPRS